MSMSFDDSTSDNTVSRGAILCLLWGATKTRPESWAKISRGLFQSQRNCAFVQTFATYFSRINGPNFGVQIAHFACAVLMETCAVY